MGLCGTPRPQGPGMNGPGMHQQTTPPWLQHQQGLNQFRQPAMSSGCGGGFGGNSLDAFIRKWGLDEGAQAMLRGMSPDAQNVVMTRFQPVGEADLSGQFIMFARGATANAANQSGMKRPAPAPWEQSAQQRMRW